MKPNQAKHTQSCERDIRSSTVLPFESAKKVGTEEDKASTLDREALQRAESRSLVFVREPDEPVRSVPSQSSTWTGWLTHFIEHMKHIAAHPARIDLPPPPPCGLHPAP
uniref:Uncharacterized protein n=1 Tax=Oryza alta TaxID=52545 RepID=A0A1V1H127_9ORYZ|nr:hypothetical protein [Oryza alta]